MLTFFSNQLQDLQEKQKLSREHEMMKRRNLQSFQADILQRQREFELKVKVSLPRLESLHFVTVGCSKFLFSLIVLAGDRDAEFGETCQL